MMSGGPVCWFSKQQACVTTSTAAAEYIAASQAVETLGWLHDFLGELGVHVTAPIPLYTDSQSAIALGKQPVTLKRGKHVRIRYHAVMHAVVVGVVSPTLAHPPPTPQKFRKKSKNKNSEKI
jgi:hypothetical protein